MSQQIIEAFRQFNDGDVSDTNLRIVIKQLRETINTLKLMDAATDGRPMHTLAIRYMHQELSRAEEYQHARKYTNP